MNFRLWGIFILMAMLGISSPTMAGTSSGADISVNLSKIGPIAPKGRVQDKEYNPHLRMVDALIEAGPDAIPFLVSKLDDDTEIKEYIIDYWDYVCVGDVALIILTDFFMTADWRSSTIPGLSFDELLERQTDDVPSWILLHDFVAKHGRAELRRKAERLLEPYDGQFVWQPTQRCFFPSKEIKNLESQLQ